MTILSVEEAQARLRDIIHQLAPGEEVVIMEKDRAVARLVLPEAEKPRPIAGRGKGVVTILAEDDEHLEDFKEYMP